jgi:hypothetical protein
MRKRTNSRATKRGGFFGLFKSKKQKKFNNLKKRDNDLRDGKLQQNKISLEDGCVDYHNVWALPGTGKNFPKCKMFCLEKQGKIIKKKLLGKKKMTPEVCPSSKYIWSSNKSKSFPSSKKCAVKKRSCW